MAVNQQLNAPQMEDAPLDRYNIIQFAVEVKSMQNPCDQRTLESKSGCVTTQESLRNNGQNECSNRVSAATTAQLTLINCAPENAFI